ncbi:hypothetical protein IEN85_14765 [Pelagicoccus sp. NFK12]|uniref:Uncharacterized protein n=1 Tax=Pelagicoccus enzymogenes TaxID=2773457 RepID=A0A927FAD7_9BACT|nr:hypothetical protein [Pelagicoccus enzymogenes]MBD5780760.1 hypothetical protein [Pelagicoccus enzymogenes]
MSHIYTQERTPATSNLKALFLGILGVTAIFGILPLLTGIPDLLNRIPITPPDEIALQRPPEIPVEPPKPEIKKDKIEIKDLEEPLPLITPDQMALLLNPSHNGAGVYVDTGMSFLEGDDTSMTTFMQSELDQ